MKTNTINKLLGITESYKAPEAMLRKILNKKSKEKLFKEFLKHEKDLSYEWFRNYFENEHSDRKVKKQDFTPETIANLMVQLAGDNSCYYEVAAGTGTIMIKEWEEKLKRNNFMAYDPRKYWYQVEELSDRAIPFLLFNMAIRGMNGVALHGDSLTREFKEVYFIRNDTDNYLNFSEIIKMPKTEELMKELSIWKWIKEDSNE